MKSKNGGIALILAVGILAILAMVAVGFSVFARLELKATENYTNQIKAELIAEAGIARAIQELKYGTEGPTQDPYDTADESFFYQGNASGEGVTVDLKDATHPSFDNLDGDSIGNSRTSEFGGGEFKLKVIDCASQININDSNPNLSNMLEKLPGIGSALAPGILAKRTELGGEFSSKEEIKLVTGIGEGTYGAIKDYLSLYGDADTGDYTLAGSLGLQPGHSNICFINVNTAPKEVLIAVLAPIMTSGSSTLADDIISRRITNPFDGLDPQAGVVDNFLCARSEWQRFLEYKRTQGVITSDADLQDILKYTNPNRYDPAATNTPTTYFSFDSGGYYEIEAIGEYKGATKRIKKIVQIYRKIYQTTKAEFDVNNGKIARITTRDNVPTNLSMSYSGYAYDPDPAKAEPIANSIKLGFWDDFSDAGYTDSVWQKVTGDYNIVSEKLVTIGFGYWPTIKLGKDATPALWRLAAFSAIVRIEDEFNNKGRLNLPYPSLPAGWGNVEIPTPPPSPPPSPEPGQYSVDMWGKWHGPMYQKSMNTGHFLFRRQGVTDTGSVYISALQTEQGWVNTGSFYQYFKPEMATLSNKLILARGEDNNSADCTYRPNKTFHLKVVDSSATSKVYWATGGPVSVSCTWTSGLPDEGYLALYGSDNRPDMDDVRVIPTQGVYTSKTFDPTESAAVDTIEWGTISASVSLPDNAQESTEKVFIHTGFGFNLSTIPGPADLPPVDPRVHSPSGGRISSGTWPQIVYRAYLFSGYQDSSSNFDKAPVLEDVTITYLPRTQIVYQNKN